VITASAERVLKHGTNETEKGKKGGDILITSDKGKNTTRDGRGSHGSGRTASEFRQSRPQERRAERREAK